MKLWVCFPKAITRKRFKNVTYTSCMFSRAQNNRNLIKNILYSQKLRIKDPTGTIIFVCNVYKVKLKDGEIQTCEDMCTFSEIGWSGWWHIITWASMTSFEHMAAWFQSWVLFPPNCVTYASSWTLYAPWLLMYKTGLMIVPALYGLCEVKWIYICKVSITHWELYRGAIV